MNTTHRIAYRRLFLDGGTTFLVRAVCVRASCVVRCGAAVQVRYSCQAVNCADSNVRPQILCNRSNRQCEEARGHIISVFDSLSFFLARQQHTCIRCSSRAPQVCYDLKQTSPDSTRYSIELVSADREVNVTIFQSALVL